MDLKTDHQPDLAEWYFFSGGPGAPRYGDDPTKHAVDHDSEAFVREVLQNANDQGLSNDDPVEVTFRFLTLTGEDKRDFLNALQWDEHLAPRLQAISDSGRGRNYRDVLERTTSEDDELRLLLVEDRNTTGLTGGWEDDSNYAALVRDELYSSKEDETAGGSYGLGKSVLWTFSGTSTVVFSSNPNYENADRETPRLIARSKFPTHTVPDSQTTYQGAGWLCNPVETSGGLRPQSITGVKATQLAEQLHIARPSATGTSAMVVDYRDPTRDERLPVEDLAEEFVTAAVKYFWPAIYRGNLVVSVETSEVSLEADVNSVPTIRPFVQCYAERFSDSGSLDNPGDVAGLDVPIHLPPRSNGTDTPEGTVRLAARLASPADDDTYLNKIALFRGTGMVVKYLDQNRVAYGDRNFHGILATGNARTDTASSDADREIDRFLRFAEPPEHDEWESTENLREQYQRGFRTALDEMFDTARDGLRHLIATHNTVDTLSENVLNRFPIHGTGTPRSTSTPADPIFDIGSTTIFESDHWVVSGDIETLVDDFEGWTADVDLWGIGEDGARLDRIPLTDVSVEADRVTTVVEDGAVRLIADGETNSVNFECISESPSSLDFIGNDAGETELEIHAELESEADL